MSFGAAEREAAFVFAANRWRAEGESVDTAVLRDAKAAATDDDDEDGGKREFNSFLLHGTLNRFQETFGRNVPKAQT